MASLRPFLKQESPEWHRELEKTKGKIVSILSLVHLGKIPKCAIDILSDDNVNFYLINCLIDDFARNRGRALNFYAPAMNLEKGFMEAIEFRTYDELEDVMLPFFENVRNSARGQYNNFGNALCELEKNMKCIRKQLKQ